MVRILSYILLFAIFGGGLRCREAGTPPSYADLRPLLNSERIERACGSYGIELLETGPIRVSNLYSQENGRRVCRSLAIVLFSHSIPEELMMPYQEIRRGSSLGSTLKKAGWTVDKRHQFFGETAAGNRFRELANLEGHPEDTKYAIHIYTLWAVKGNTRHPFSTIAEIHHPKYLELKDLKGIYQAELIGNLEADSEDLEMIALAKSASESGS